MRRLNVLSIFGVMLFINSCATTSQSNIAGAWKTDLFEIDSICMLLNNGQWNWKNVETPGKDLFGGTWFVHDNILVLRILRSESDKILPGLSFTLDIKEAKQERLIVYDLQTRREYVWKKCQTANKK